MLTTGIQARDEILARFRVAMPHLRARYPLIRMAVFGSVARGEAHPGSDVDILVELEADAGIEFFQLALNLERLLGRRVDLVSCRGIKERYLRLIEKDLVYV